LHSVYRKPTTAMNWQKPELVAEGRRSTWIRSRPTFPPERRSNLQYFAEYVSVPSGRYRAAEDLEDFTSRYTLRAQRRELRISRFSEMAGKLAHVFQSR